jgi:uncharacterized protein YbjT (DUF2867 family)
VADLAVQSGVREFALVSSVGADAGSRNFYLSVKGETEEAVGKRPFRALHIIRPGLLLGDREESRPAETLFRALAPLFNPVLLGPLRQYRAVSASDVAAAMIETVLRRTEGRHVFVYDSIVELARAFDARPGSAPESVVRP